MEFEIRYFKIPRRKITEWIGKSRKARNDEVNSICEILKPSF
jgi:hypothetical protein